MTDDDWKNIWDEFDIQLDTLEDELQQENIKAHGEGYYTTDEHLYWLMQKKLIRRLVEAKLREKNETKAWFTIDEFNEWAEKLIEKEKNKCSPDC